MSAVLVTGATGGLGRVLVAVLAAAGREVIATGRDAQIGALLAGPQVRFVAAELARDPLAPLVRGVGTVFHLAARSSPWGTAEQFAAANVTATQRLLEAARNAGAAGFVFTSTPSIYTAPRDQLGLTEAAPLPRRLVNHYACTKLAAERLVLAYAMPGFATAAIRPRAIISPFDTVLLPRLLRAARTGVLPLPRGGRALIEPTDARDVAAALLAAEAALPQVSGRVFNISGGAPLPLAQLAGHVFASLGAKVRMPAIPARLALALGGAAEFTARLHRSGREPALTRYSAMALGWSQTFDLTAARGALGWDPHYRPLDAIDWALESRDA